MTDKARPSCAGWYRTWLIEQGDLVPFEEANDRRGERFAAGKPCLHLNPRDDAPRNTAGLGEEAHR